MSLRARTVVAVCLLAFLVTPVCAAQQGGVGLEHLSAIFLGLLLHGIALASIGLVCSAWTSSQLVAAVSGWAVAFLLWGPFYGCQ